MNYTIMDTAATAVHGLTPPFGYMDMDVVTAVNASGNGTSLPESPECEFQTLRALILIPFALISILAIPGNILVMLAIFREKRLQNPTNVLVVGLALADIINGLLSVPSAYFWFVSYCDDIIILYFRFLVRTCCGCSVIHLVLISIDRYVAVSKPLKYQSLITRRRTRKCSVITWMVIVPYMLINVILYHLLELGYVELNQVAFVIFWNFLPSSMIVVAMLTTSIIYAYVFHQAHQLRTRMSSMMRSSMQTSSRTTRRTKQLRATKTLAIVVLAFAICWLPISVTIFLDSKAPGYDPVISLGPTMLYSANSFMNPLIYAHRSREFREAFKAILRDAVGCFSNQPSGTRRPIRPSVSDRRSVSDRPSMSEKPSRAGRPSAAELSSEYPAVTNFNAVV